MHTYRRVRDAQNRTGVYLKGNGETMSEEIKSSISDRFKSVMEEDEKYGDYDDDLDHLEDYINPEVYQATDEDINALNDWDKYQDEIEDIPYEDHQDLFQELILQLQI